MCQHWSSNGVDLNQTVPCEMNICAVSSDMKYSYLTLKIPHYLSVVEILVNPELKNRPFAVTVGHGTRAQLLSVSEPTSKMGIQPGARLGSISKDIIIVPASPIKYNWMNENILARLREFFHEPVVRRTGVFQSIWPGGTRFVRRSLGEVQYLLSQENIEGGWGFAKTSGVSEIASSVSEKNKLLEIIPGEEQSFLSKQPLSVLYDLNRYARENLEELGVFRLGQISELPDSLLKELFGSDGIALKQLATTGERPKKALKEWRGFRKLSADIDDPLKVNKELASLLSEGWDEITKLHVTPSIMRLTLVYSDGKRTGGAVRRNLIEHEGKWQKELLDLTDQLWKRRVRLGEIHLSMASGIAWSNQLDLFREPDVIHRVQKLSTTVASIRNKWGKHSLAFASVNGG